MESYSKKPTRKTLKFTPEQWTLSQAILANPQTCDEKRISLVGKSIARLDSVPDQFKQVESLYLSNNFLSELQGLTQFVRLKSLSIGGNRVNSVSELMVLKGLMRLENLTIEGNPVCGLAGVKEWLISGLAGLKTLDGREISGNEREKAMTATQQLESLEALAVMNEENVAVLQHLLKLLKVHKELMLTKGLEVYEGVDIHLFLQRHAPAWPELLQDQVKLSLRAKARALIGEHQLDPGVLSAAYSECIQTQQELITRLAAACDDQAKSCKSLWILPSERPKKPPTPQSRPLPPSPNLISTASRRSPKDFTYVQSKYHSLLHPKGSLSNVSSRSNSVMKLASEKGSDEERPQQLRLPIQHVEKPKKWTEEENFLEEQNKTLRAKLKEFEEINRQNVKLAEMELSRLNEELKATLHENQLLKSSKTPQNDDFPPAIFRYYRIKQLRKCLNFLSKFAQKSVSIRLFRKRREVFRVTEIGLLCLAAWRWLTKAEKYIRVKSEQRRENLETEVLFRMYKNVNCGRKMKEFVRKKEKGLKRKYFERLWSYPKTRENKETEKRVADSMRAMHLLYSTFTSWNTHTSLSKSTYLDHSHLTRRADLHLRVRTLKNAWSSWWTWHRDIGAPSRQRYLVAYSQYAHFLRRRIINLMLKAVERKRKIAISVSILKKLKGNKVELKCIKAFRRFIRMKKVRKTVKNKGNLFRRIQIFNKFKSAVEIYKEKCNKIAISRDFYTSRLLKTVLNAYFRSILHRKVLKQAEIAYIESNNRRKTQSYLQKWLLAMWRNSYQPHTFLLRRVFSAWFRFSRLSSHRKHQNHMGKFIYVRCFQRELKGILGNWKRIVEKKKNYGKILKEIEKKRIKMKTEICLKSWKNSFLRQILLKNKDNFDIFTKQNSDFQSSKIQILDLTDKISELTRENRFLSDQISDLTASKSTLEGEIRIFKQTSKEASILISTFERDFSNSSLQITQLKEEKETLMRNYEQKLGILKEELRKKEKELREMEEMVVKTVEFRKNVEENTDEHVQEVVSANDSLLAQLQSKDHEIRELSLQNQHLLEELRQKDAQLSDLERRSSPLRFSGLRSPVSAKPLLDTEPVRLNEEDQIRDQLMTLKQERAAIREEIESRMRKAEGQRRSASHSDGQMLDISSRMASLEARLASRLK